MSTPARRGAERAFLQILRNRWPDVTWIIRPPSEKEIQAVDASPGEAFRRTGEHLRSAGIDYGLWSKAVVPASREGFEDTLDFIDLLDD